MATRAGFQIILGFVAAGDLSAAQFLFVENSSGSVAVCGTLGNLCLGVVQNKDADAAGKIVQVCIFGATKVVAGAAIAKHAHITATAAGKAQLTTPDGGSSDAGEAVLGVALEAAAADTNIISAFVNCVAPSVAANTYT